MSCVSLCQVFKRSGDGEDSLIHVLVCLEGKVLSRLLASQ